MNNSIILLREDLASIMFGAEKPRPSQKPAKTLSVYDRDGTAKVKRGE
jgi:hypothetical protein